VGDHDGQYLEEISGATICIAIRRASFFSVFLARSLSLTKVRQSTVGFQLAPALILNPSLSPGSQFMIKFRHDLPNHASSRPIA
jgi:hypothetical protein